MAKEATKAKKKKPTQVTLKKVRLLWPHLFEKVKDDKGAESYDITILIKKTDKAQIAILQNAYLHARKEKFGDKKFNNFHDFKKIMVDGDVVAAEKAEEGKDYSFMKGHYRLKAKSTYEVGVYDPKREPLTDQSKAYHGCMGNVVVNAGAWDNTEFKTKGVSFYLTMVQVIPGGERLAAGANPNEFFEEEMDFDETNSFDDSGLLGDDDSASGSDESEDLF